MNPKQFLLWGGVILVVLGLAGLFFLGPDAQSSLLGEFFWLDNTENLAHLLFGVVALAAYYFVKEPLQIKWLTMAVGVVAIIVALLGFINAGGVVPNTAVTNLENPADNILHLVVGIWAIGVNFVGKE